MERLLSMKRQLTLEWRRILLERERLALRRKLKSPFTSISRQSIANEQMNRLHVEWADMKRELDELHFQRIECDRRRVPDQTVAGRNPVSL
jgi:hypothetical protein